MPDAGYEDIAVAAAELAVTVGLIQVSMQRPPEDLDPLEGLTGAWPEEVRENFQEKVDQTVERLREMTQEFLQFGEVYDE